MTCRPSTRHIENPYGDNAAGVTENAPAHVAHLCLVRPAALNAP